MASSSSSKRIKRVRPSERNASPSRWISDNNARERFMGWKNVKEIVPHKALDLFLFRKEGFIFPEKLAYQGINNWCNLPYCVFISKVITLSNVVLIGETKVICNKINEIGKAILTCISLKKTAMGWIFSDEQIQVKNNDEVFDSDEEQVSFSPKSEFKKFVVKRFEKISKKASKMKKTVISMEEKMNEIIKNYVETTTSTEESTDEDDESSKEDYMEIYESK
ncbi:hypothetical protein LR48_Vigan682s000500 [Vigna angularis]|uniref:Uncharacterized protein n=1 Tax=Phaseolus angularis TaxID=3914 RepID=A0A0L9TG38_PHAAN|nr:hypothetical protein LR48_Vigan682s000500 [Vigna angularis]